MPSSCDILCSLEKQDIESEQYQNARQLISMMLNLWRLSRKNYLSCTRFYGKNFLQQSEEFCYSAAAIAAAASAAAAGIETGDR